MRLNRRSMLIQAGGAALAPILGSGCTRSVRAGGASTGGLFRRVRPSDPSWPDAAAWETLNRQVGGQLIKTGSPLEGSREASKSGSCAEVFTRLKNPYYVGDEVGLTQTLGWVDAWTSQPSAYALGAHTARLGYFVTRRRLPPRFAPAARRPPPLPTLCVRRYRPRDSHVYAVGTSLPQHVCPIPRRSRPATTSCTTDCSHF